jgi:hypothetical protein
MRTGWQEIRGGLLLGQRAERGPVHLLMRGITKEHLVGMDIGPS